MSRNVLLLSMLAVFLSGCAQIPKRALHNPESALRTDGPTTMLFHSVLYYPGAISLNFPGYIVGIEKSPVEIVTDKGDIKVSGKPADGLDKEGAYKEIVDKKILYVSHVIRDINAPYGIGNCYLYNAYVQPGDNETEQLVPPCPGLVYSDPVCPKEAYKKSWEALDILKTSVKEELETGEYTHVVILTLGWNTVQEEAIRNFKTIIKYIKAAADSRGHEFKPLFIGVTWPSQWQSSWFGPLVKALSFSVKANDADELGLTWLGVLLQDTLPKAMKGLENPPTVVVIGHSFGARASSVAACVGPVIQRDGMSINGGPERPRLKTILINLEGAFFIRRLLGTEHDRGLFFHDQCATVSRVFLTSSKYDFAMDAMFLGPYAGNYKSYDRYCKNGSTKDISCVHADKDGEIVEKEPFKHLVYINADRLIYQNAYLSGGGAHSDIYRPEHGVLLWNLISNSE